MGTATRMTRARAAAKNAFTEPPSTAPPSQLSAPSPIPPLPLPCSHSPPQHLFRLHKMSRPSVPCGWVGVIDRFFCESPRRGWAQTRPTSQGIFPKRSRWSCILGVRTTFMWGAKRVQQCRAWFCRTGNHVTVADACAQFHACVCERGGSCPAAL